MKYIKRCLLAVVVLVALLLIALFIITTFYKKEIAEVLVKHLKTNFALTLKAEDVDVSLFENFPQASVSLKDISIDNDLHPASVSLLRAGKVTVSFNLRKLVKKQFEVKAVSIETATLNLVTNEDGSKNFEFKKRDSLTASGPGLDFDIHKVSIRQTEFSFTNKERGQHIAFLLADNVLKMKKHAEGFDFGLKGNVKIAGLLFNSSKGAFLKETDVLLDLEGVLFKETKSCFIRDPSFVEIEGMTYAVNSFVRLGEEKSLALKVSAKDLSYQKGVKLVNPKIARILSNFSISKPFDIDFLLFTKLGQRQEPVVLVKVNTAHNHVSIGNSKVSYDDVSFNGLVLSLDSSMTKGDPEQALVRFSGIKGTIYEVPFTASVKLHNFENPKVAIDAALFIDAQKVKLKASEEFDLRGKCIAHLSYSGAASKINKKEFLSSDVKLRASLAFKDFSYKEKHKPYVYVVNGKANITNSDMTFNNLVLKTNGGSVSLKGKVEQFTPYVLGLGNGLKINLEAYTNEFNLNPFMKAASGKDTSRVAGKSQAKTVKKIDDQSVFDFNVSLRAKRMLIRKVVAEDVTMNLAYKNSLLNLRSVHMNTCGGKLKVSGTIQNLETVKATIAVDNINVTTLFEQFEDFGQQAIQSKHLRGKISLQANFNASLDDKVEIVPSSMLGEVTLKLREGHLLEYDPLQNVSNFIFHNRDFNDITFSEINERFRLNGYEMQIEELEVASNILNLFVSGTYNFKSHSNINLVIPWSNLKRRGKHYIPKSSGMTADETKGLKLNYSGQSKKMKLSLGHK